MGDGGPELEDIEEEDGEGGHDLEMKFKEKTFCSSNQERKSLQKKVRALEWLSNFTICIAKSVTPIKFLIGPLHDPATWYTITYSGEQVAPS